MKTALTTLLELGVLLHLTIPTNLVGRKNKRVHTSQAPGEITSELLLVHQPGLYT
jgi:hypothetical protein